MNTSTDLIERSILLQAPVSRVWRALSNAEEFGNWFGVALKGQVFAAGQHARGHITHPGYEHYLWDVLVETMEPERLLTFRWHPYAIDPAMDYSTEPTTLVAFEIRPAEGGCLLTIAESGFDSIPLSRREEAYRMNSGGWDAQIDNVQKHVAGP